MGEKKKKALNEKIRVGRITIYTRRPQTQNWYKSYTVNGVQKRESMHTTSKTAALKRAMEDNELLDQYNRGDYIPPPNIPTFGEAIKNFMEYSKTRGNTEEGLKNKEYFMRILLDYFAKETPITSLCEDVAGIKGFMAFISARGVSPTTRNRYLEVLRSIILNEKENLESKGIVLRNPIKKDMYGVEQNRVQFFGEKMLLRVLEKAKEISSKINPDDLADGSPQKRNQFYFFPYIVIAAATGARWSSIKYLKGSDFIVDTTMENEGEEKGNEGEEKGKKMKAVWHYVVFRKSKTKKPLRLQIPESVYHLFMNLPKNSIFIFDVRRKTPVEKRKAHTFRHHWNRLREELGLAKFWTPYYLRHTFATMMLKKGVNHRELQLMLGHSNITSTERYTHPGTGEKTIDLIDDVITGSTNQAQSGGSV